MTVIPYIVVGVVGVTVGLVSDATVPRFAGLHRTG